MKQQEENFCINTRNQIAQKQEINDTKMFKKKKTTVCKLNRMNKFCIYSLLASSILISILLLSSTTFQTSEAKKIKIKDLKKAKKYAYLLATQRKKFYAIPVPLPLPVFVKRQQIYTQIPVVPRFVQQPPSYSSHQPHQSSYYTSSGGGYGEQQATYDPYASAMSSSYEYQQQLPVSSHFKYPYRYPMSSGSLMGLGGGSSKSKYLASLAQALGQAYPVLGGAAQGVVGSNVVGKLLSGQAKVLPPSQIKNLLFSSGKTSTTGSYKQSSSSSSAKDQSGDDQHEGDENGKHSSKDNSSSSSSASNSTAKDNQDKPSASESIYSTMYNPYDLYNQPGNDYYQQHHSNNVYHHHRPSQAHYYPIRHHQQQFSYPAHHHHAAHQSARIIPTFIAPSAYPQLHPFAAAGSGAGPIPDPTAMAAAANELLHLMAGAAATAGHPDLSLNGAESAGSIPNASPLISNLNLLNAAEQMQLQESQKHEALDNDGDLSSSAEVPAASKKSTENNQALDNKKQQLEQTIDAQKKQLAMHSALLRQKLEAQLASANTFAIAAHQLGLPTAANQHIRLINF